MMPHAKLAKVPKWCFLASKMNAMVLVTPFTSNKTMPDQMKFWKNTSANGNFCSNGNNGSMPHF